VTRARSRSRATRRDGSFAFVEELHLRGAHISTRAMASGALGEVITLQFGSRANWTGAHFWNFQVMPSSARPSPRRPRLGAIDRSIASLARSEAPRRAAAPI
jgi:hypothetical protein